ncbi:uncharacterized protein KD926_006204 [Aspergillus affinis]|uniref:uncharacterized protein n=1 Tax=Aspergillus affinis TaxID=1070780 RepID=UPI0022FE8FFE|nr:uncharacterized protein KD926_006204 [Aspergillus affinis]KAI9042080.1 hypothetical protein KD926_006204 [Aspergillus affinis]
MPDTNSLNPSPQATWRVIPIQITSEEGGTENEFGNGISLPFLLQLAWGTLLRVYTGQDEVKFDYQCLISSSFESIEKTGYEEVFIPQTRSVLIPGNRPFNKITPSPSTGDLVGNYKQEIGQDSMIQIWGAPKGTMATEAYARLLVDSTPQERSILITGVVSHDECCVFLSLRQGQTFFHLADHIADTFRHLLQKIREYPLSTFNELRLVGPNNLRQIEEWTAGTAVIRDDDKCPYEAIETWPKPSPAIDAWDERISYGDLTHLSNALAGNLVSIHGAQRGEYIPVCFEKSAWAIVAMLGIHKAGAAFVPIDPACPPLRLAEILQQTKARLLLTSPTIADTTSCVSKLKEDSSTVLSIVHVDSELLEQEITRDVINHRPAPTDVAYCLFTSGSTGKPKGVVVDHRALNASLRAHGKYFGLSATSRVLQGTSYTFDVSLTECLGTLYHGGCVCVPKATDHLHDTVGCINNMDVNWAFFTPSFAQILSSNDVPGLKALALGGEEVPTACVEQWTAPGRRLINAYGPTECSIFSMSGNIKLDVHSSGNIGRAVGGLSFVTDPTDPSRLMPIGAPGELLLCGPILAQGYLNDNGKTAKAFIDPPEWFKNVVGWKNENRLYRTGDLVRYCADGTVEYLGRIDRQVKIHGQRIELGEIERAIISSKESTIAVVDVVSRPNMPNDQVLVAFVADEDGKNYGPLHALDTYEHAVSIKDLKARLASLLPRYMLPSDIIYLSHVPLSSSGKLDRAALRNLAADILGNHPSGQLKEDRLLTETEELIQLTWSHVLSIPQHAIRVDDSFFRWGNSLAAIKLTKRLQECGLQISVADIFQGPSILDMAAKVRQTSKSQGKMDLIPFGLIEPNALPEVLENAAQQCSVKADAIHDIYPCTSTQEALLSLTVHNHEAYNAQYVYHLPHGTDIDRFQKAWDSVFRSTPILRTRIISGSRSFYQVVLSENIEWLKSSNLEEYVQNDQLIPVAFGRELTRFALIPDPNGIGICFVWTIHHSLYDGHSMSLVLGDVQHAYDLGYHPQRPLFSSYIQSLTDDSRDLAAFWRGSLDGFSSQTFPLKSHPEYHPVADRTITLYPSTQNRASMEVSHSVVLQAAWAIVFARYVESTDVAFGVTLSGRYGSLPSIDEISGPTLSTVPLRARIDREKPVDLFLRELQTHLAHIMECETIGLQNLRKLTAATQRACDFQTLFVIQPSLTPNDDDGLFSIGHLAFSHETITGYGLTVEAQLDEDGLSEVRAHFDSSLIDEQQVERILKQWEYVVNQLYTTTSPGRQLREISPVSPEEVRQLSQWNAPIPKTANVTLHGLIKQRVTENPDKEALVGWDGSYTYQGLWNASDRLAAHLKGLGIRNDDLIPLCLEKSSYAIVCMLAILKAGAAFVPLDSRHPPERLAGIVDQIKPRLLITSPQYQSLWDNINHLALDADIIAVLPRLSADSDTSISATETNLAYCIFTSGSTGQPKGVLIEHQAICTSILSYSRRLQIHENVRTLQFASYSFDASLLELLSALVNGATVCTPSLDECMDSISQTIQHYGPTWVFLTPSVAQMLSPASAPSIQTLVLGGEAITRSVIATWDGKVRLFNAYGPTECSIVCAVNEVRSEDDVGVIGYPSGCALWVVDPDDPNELVPIGTVGEMLVEGSIEARGYLNDAIKTEGAFIPIPQWRKTIKDLSTESTRMYKTGDLVRWNEDGTLYYFGRKDLQVKVRGQRVELEEIESCIVHPDIIRSAVIQPRRGPYSKRLVGIFTLRASQPATDDSFRLIPTHLQKTASKVVSSIREKLLSELPSYMVPDDWIAIENIPLTAAAKTNTKFLIQNVEEITAEHYTLASKISEGEDESTSKPALTPMGEVLRDLLASLLQVPGDSIHGETSFFRIGGDSVSAMQLVSQCRAQGLTISVTDVLKYKTVSKIAERLRKKALPTSAPAVQDSEPIETAFSLSPIQQLWMDSVPTDKVPVFTQSFLLRLRHDVSPVALERALVAVVERHSMLRARFSREVDGHWTQRITTDSRGSYKLIEHKAAVPETEIPGLTASARAKLDVVCGPTIVIERFDSMSGDSLLFVAAHHLVVDLVSWRIILRDLEALLESKVLSQPFSVTFQQWCLEQSRWQLSNASSNPASPLSIPPSDHDFWGMSGKTNHYGSVERLEAKVETKISTSLLSRSADVLGAEPQDVFLTALLIAFCEIFPDRAEPAIFNESHGRQTSDSDIDITETVGWFTSLSPILLPGIPEKKSIIEVLRRVKDNRHRLLETGNQTNHTANMIQRDQRRATTTPEILFNYEGIFQQLEKPDGLFHFVPQHNGDLADMADDVPRLALIEVAVQIHEGQIAISSLHNREMSHQGRIQGFVRQYRKVLLEMNHALEQQVQPVHSLSDFPLASLTYQELDEVTKAVEEGGVQGIYPLLPTQQVMLSRQSKFPALYSPRFVLRLQSNAGISPNGVADAWKSTVLRHAILRTVFLGTSSDGDPLQVVLERLEPLISYLPHPAKDVNLLDLPISPWEEREAHHRLIIYEQDAGSVEMLLLEISHALVDFPTMEVVFEDFHNALRDTPVQSGGSSYQDLIAYAVDPSRRSLAEAFWTARLANAPASHVSTQGSRSGSDHFFGKHRYSDVQLGPVTPSVRAVCQDHEISLASVVRLAWAQALREWLAADDVTFGVVLSGRDIELPDVHQIAGPFLNFVPCRISFDSNSPTTTRVPSLLRSLDEAYLESLAHQIRGSTAGSILYDTIVNYRKHNNSRDGDSIGTKIEGREHELVIQEAVDPFHFSMVLEIDEIDGALNARIAYWTGRVSEKVVAHFTKTIPVVMLRIVEAFQLRENP